MANCGICDLFQYCPTHRPDPAYNQVTRAPVKQSDLDTIKSQLIELMEALRKEIHERFEIVDHTINALEKQMAMVTLSLGEQACLIEGLLSLVQEQDNDKLMERVKASRKAMLKSMQEGASAIEGEDSKLAATLAAMVAGM